MVGFGFSSYSITVMMIVSRMVIPRGLPHCLLEARRVREPHGVLVLEFLLLSRGFGFSFRVLGAITLRCALGCSGEEVDMAPGIRQWGVARSGHLCLLAPRFLLSYRRRSFLQRHTDIPLRVIFTRDTPPLALWSSLAASMVRCFACLAVLLD